MAAFRNGPADETRVRIELAGEAESWRPAAAGCPRVKEVTADAERLFVTMEEQAAVPRLVAMLAAAGAPVLQVVTERLTLEAAYLARIREPE